MCVYAFSVLLSVKLQKRKITVNGLKECLPVFADQHVYLLLCVKHP